MRKVRASVDVTFATDRDTRLDVCLLKIQNGADDSESGFDCGPHPSASGTEQAALQVGTTEKPVDANHTATIRLTYVDGMDKNSFPALICCGGRMDLHGAPLRFNQAMTLRAGMIASNGVLHAGLLALIAESSARAG